MEPNLPFSLEEKKQEEKAPHSLERAGDACSPLIVYTRGWGVLPYKRLTGCAAGWGRIFTTGSTILGSHLQ